MNNLNFSMTTCRLKRLSLTIKENITLKGNVLVEPAFRYNYSFTENKITFLLCVEIKENNLPFYIETEYEGTFEFSESLVTIKYEIDKIANIYCAAMLLPFIRETIAEVTRKAGLRPFILPAINFNDIYEKQIAPKNKTENTEKLLVKF